MYLSTIRRPVLPAHQLRASRMDALSIHHSTTDWCTIVGAVAIAVLAIAVTWAVLSYTEHR